MGGQPEIPIPPALVQRAMVQGMRGGPHYGQPYNFSRKMVGRFYQDNSLRSGAYRKEQEAAELRRKAANASRLQMLKLQYSERRKLVENDLVREAMHIQEMEAKLMQIQQQRGTDPGSMGLGRRGYGRGMKEAAGMPIGHYGRGYPSPDSVLSTNRRRNRHHHRPYGEVADEGEGDESGEEPEMEDRASMRPVRGDHDDDDDDDEDHLMASSAFQSPVVRHHTKARQVAPGEDHVERSSNHHEDAETGSTGSVNRRRRRARSMPEGLERVGAKNADENEEEAEGDEEGAGKEDRRPTGSCSQQQQPPNEVLPSAAAASPAVPAPVVPPVMRHILDPSRVELRQLSVEEIGKVLKNHSLGLYEDIFGTNCVDGETLMDPTLAETDLSELGVKIRLHRKRLLDLIHKFKAEGVPLSDLATPAAAVPPPSDLLPSPVRMASRGAANRLLASREGGSRRSARGPQQTSSLLLGCYTSNPLPMSRGASRGSSMSVGLSPTKKIVLPQSRAGTADSNNRCSSRSGCRALPRSRQSAFRALVGPSTEPSACVGSPYNFGCPAAPDQTSGHTPSTSGFNNNDNIQAAAAEKAVLDGGDGTTPVQATAWGTTRTSAPVAGRTPQPQSVSNKGDDDDDESSCGFASDFEDHDGDESLTDIFA